MKNSRARKHYLDIVYAVGTMDERRAEKRGPMGFQPPTGGRTALTQPKGIEYQAWEDWYWEGEG